MARSTNARKSEVRGNGTRTDARTRRAHQSRAQRTQRGSAARSTIFDVLRRDHRRIVQLMNEVEETSDNALQTREDLFKRLRDQLDFHSRAEESVFYSRLKNIAPTNHRVLKSMEEHHVVTLLLGELDLMPKNHERWLAKFGVLREGVQHHVEQEEDGLFAEAERLLSEEQTHKLASEMIVQEEAWLELERRSPMAAGVVRGMTQVAERLPFGSGMIAATVQGNPQLLARIVRMFQSVVPSRRRGLFGAVYRMVTLPISLPLSMATAR